MAQSQPSPELAARKRQVAGMALIAGAVTMVAAAVLTYTGLLPVGDDLRGLLTGVFAMVAAVDIVIALRFLLASQP